MFRSLVSTYSLLLTVILPIFAQPYDARTSCGPDRIVRQAHWPLRAGLRWTDQSKYSHSPAGSTLASSGSHQPAAVPDDVIIGKPRQIPYSEAFPLLDGMFQDVAAMQVAALSLNSSAANGSYTSALIQQFQASLQYSQTLGLQNSAAAQQSGAYSAAGALQSQLINQESQLINLQLAAQQQVAQAQSVLNTASAEQKAAAQQAYTMANDNLTSIAAQLALVKGYVSTALTAPTYNAPTPSAMTFPAPIVLPSPISTSATLPSFPASKQMENQVNLLWERLAHLVNVLTQASDPDATSLIVFHTDMTPGKGKRKHQLLSTKYALTCTDATMTPQVIDLFPRNAAVNIVNEKYKDSKFGLGAFLSFFSIGANAAYNREHLQITQALGQSGYITGFGIETNSFGWVFAPTLGEDTIAPGDRTTFAVVTTPHGCGEATVKLVNAEWNESPRTADPTPPIPTEKTVSQHWCATNSDSAKVERCAANCIQSISYSPTEFDPAAANNGSVSLDIRLGNFELDREERVEVNGSIVRRARDNFGRATPSAGSGGLLESQTFDVGTWIPVNERELILNLNPAFVSRQFPSIRLTSPKGSIDLTSYLSSAKIKVAGSDFDCPSISTRPCASILPSMGRVKATSMHFAVARWSGLVPTDQGANRVIITAPGVATLTGGTGPVGIPALQVITDSDIQTWSARAKVVALQDDGKNYHLQCEPRGQRLICKAGELDMDKNTDFDIFDGDYAGGAVKGSGSLERCSADSPCPDPLVWKTELPIWNPDLKQWDLQVWLINVPTARDITKPDMATLNIEGNIAFKAPIDNCARPDNICQAIFHFPRLEFAKVRDSLQLRVKDYSLTVDRDSRPTTLSGLRALMSPLVYSISDDQTQFSGQNLVFEKIQVSTTGEMITLDCCNGTDCNLGKSHYKDGAEGYLYLILDPTKDSTRVPLMQLNDKSITPIAHHSPPKQPADKGGAVASGNAPATQPPAVTIVINNNRRGLAAIK